MRFQGGRNGMVLDRRKLAVTVAARAAFVLLLWGLLAAPAWAQAGGDPITGEIVQFQREGDEDTGAIESGTIDVSEFDGCDVEEGATITVEDDDGTRAVFEDLERDDGNTDTANAEIRSEGDEIVIEPRGNDTTITPEQTERGRTPGLQGDAEVVESTGITCEEPPEEGEGGDLNINDESTNQVCNNVVNIFVSNFQYGNIDQSESVISGDGSDQIGVISQYLNVSPEIVQFCIQQIGDNDGNDDDDNNDGDTNDGDTNDDGDTNGDDASGDDGNNAQDDNTGTQAAEDVTISGDDNTVIQGTIPDKPLPNTGGAAVWWVGLPMLLFVAAGVLAPVMGRRGL